MIEYRAFRNSDTPGLAEIWRSAPAARGLAQPMSATMLETYVLSKPYFDRAGLIVATQQGRPVGFVHAGFGPSEKSNGLDFRTGVVSLMLVHERVHSEQIQAELLRRAEAYLAETGGREIYAFGNGRINPFYAGLYGGSGAPGLLESGPPLIDFFDANGYRLQGKVAVLHRELAGFRPLVDRFQMQIRRTSLVRSRPDPPARDWWRACTMGSFDQIRFELVPRGGDRILAEATFWNMQPLSAGWGVHAMGLVDLETLPETRRHGMATYLLGESLRQLHSEGFTLIETQVREDDLPAMGLFHKLGFQRVDTGRVMAKTLA